MASLVAYLQRGRILAKVPLPELDSILRSAVTLLADDVRSETYKRFFSDVVAEHALRGVPLPADARIGDLAARLDAAELAAQAADPARREAFAAWGQSTVSPAIPPAAKN